MTNRSGIYLMVSVTMAVVLTISAVVLAPALTSAGGTGAAPAVINPADFSTNTDCTWLPSARAQDG